MKWTEQRAYKITNGALVVNIKYIDNKIIISEHSTDGTSLTNCIENVLYDVVLNYSKYTGYTHSVYEYYQWCDGEGLFKLEIGPKVTRAMPPIKVNSWTKVADDLKAFEVLFA